MGLRQHLFCIILLCFSLSKVSGQTIYEQIIQNVQNVQWENTVDINILDKNVAHWDSTLTSEGVWKDIDLSSRTQTMWQPQYFLRRVKDMAAAYTDKRSKYFRDEHLFATIQSLIQRWYDADPRSTNWWIQQIFCPKMMGEILILMRSGKRNLSSNLENKLLTRMQLIGGDPNNQYCTTSSSNKINIAVHWIYRGCLSQNDSVMKVGIENALSPIQLSPPRLGIQYDYSYQEHGPQLYIGNYGYAFIDNIANVGLYLVGTSYALSGERLEIYSNFVRNTYLSSVRGQYYSFSIPGRQIANKDSLYRGGQLSQLRRLMKVDPQHKMDYENALLRWSGQENADYKIVDKYDGYWNSDYVRKIQKGYSFDVRFVSNRTVRTENINHEDKLGYFLSDGGTNMTIDGGEYYNVFSVWDWCKIPGTTAPQLDTLPEMFVNVGGSKGSTDFCGSVNDSLNGAAVYTMNYEQFKTSAHKSWFFFNEAIVCLGAAITSKINNYINTTVNQTLLKGTVLWGNNKQVDTVMFGTKKRISTKQFWVWHNGFGYYFPNAGNYDVEATVRSGDWSMIATLESNEKVNKNVFTLTIDHGINPINGNYSYIIFPNTLANAMPATITSDRFNIVANTKEKQIVYDRQYKILECILYDKNQEVTYNSNQILAADPIAIMVKTIGGKMMLSIADPSQKLAETFLHIKNKNGGIRTLKIVLPQGHDRGKTTSIMLD